MIKVRRSGLAVARLSRAARATAAFSVAVLPLTLASSMANVAEAAPTTTCTNVVETADGSYTVIKFVTAETCTWTPPEDNLSVQYLIVGGGGGGGAAGGGAGGLLAGSTTLGSATALNISVGAGGAGGPGISSAAVSGGNSSFNGFTAIGGGAGAAYAGLPQSGGSGGGSSPENYSAGGSSTTGQGNAGGAGSFGGGGGGGAGTAGTTSSPSTNRDGGNGGDGVASSITGSSIYYAGGGGGMCTGGCSAGSSGGQGGGGNGSRGRYSNDDTAGTANTGGGGGGADGGSAGGSGVVILRFLTPVNPCLAGSVSSGTLLDASTCTPAAGYYNQANLAWVKLTTSSNVWVTGLKAYRPPLPYRGDTGNSGNLRVRLESSTGASLATASWGNSASSASAQWVTSTLNSPVAITSGSTFWLGIHADWTEMYYGGTYPSTSIGPLTIMGTLAGSNVAFNGPWGAASGSTIPWVDFVFTTTAPATAPDAPTLNSLTAGDGTLEVTSTLGSANGATIDRVDYSTNGGSDWTTSGQATGNFTISGLTNGTSYSVKIRAHNSVGNSTGSNIVSGTPRTVPGAPTSVTASAGNARASVDWNAPTSNGGSAVTGYTVTSSPAGASCTVSGTAATCTGLSNGTGYRFTVKATNAAGDSVASSASASVTPSAPAPPPEPTPDPTPTPRPTASNSPPPPPQNLPPPTASAQAAPPLRPAVNGPRPGPSVGPPPGESAPPRAGESASPRPGETPPVRPSETPPPRPNPSSTNPPPPQGQSAPSGAEPLSPPADPVVAAEAFAAAAEAPPAPVAVPEGGLFGGGESGPKFDVNIGVSPGKKAAGSPVVVRASGLRPNSPVQIVVHSDPQVIGTSQSDTTGVVSMEAYLPDNLPAGPHTVVVEGIGASGEPVQIMGAMQLDDQGIVTGVAPPAEATGQSPDGDLLARALATGKPVYDVASNPVGVATVAAAGAAVAAVAGAAAGAAGAAGASGAAGSSTGGSGGGSSGGGSSSGGSSNSNQSGDGGLDAEPEKGKGFRARSVAAAATGTAAVVSMSEGHDGGHAHGHVFRPRHLAELALVGAAVGDASRSWNLPLTDSFHDGLEKFSSKVARYSIILPRSIADGAWARAMFGSGAQLLWFAGIALGVISLVQTGFQAIPASTPLLLAIMALGILDSMAGLLAWAVIFLGALFTGHIREIADMRTAVGVALIAMTLSLLANYIRPLRRPKSTGWVHVFDRVTDYSIPPIVIAFGAAGMAKALNGLSGLEIISSEETLAIQIVAGAAVLARMGLEDLAVHLYPMRCAAVEIATPPPPSKPWRIAAIIARTVITILILSAFIGMSWFTFVLALLFAVPLVLRVWEERLPNLATLHRWTPRGLVKLTIVTIAGVLLATWIFKSESTAAMLPAIMGILMLPTAFLSIVDTFARSGGVWGGVWVKRVAGIALWALCAGVITGVIVLAH